MKYWNSGLNAPGSRTFTTTVHIAAAAIGWRSSGKERTRQTQFSTKFASKLSFIPPLKPNLLNFLPGLKKFSSPMWPKRGFWCRLFLTLPMPLIYKYYYSRILFFIWEKKKGKHKVLCQLILCNIRSCCSVGRFSVFSENWWFRF
jgi:hypothetical protein